MNQNIKRIVLVGIMVGIAGAVAWKAYDPKMTPAPAVMAQPHEGNVTPIMAPNKNGAPAAETALGRVKLQPAATAKEARKASPDNIAETRSHTDYYQRVGVLRGQSDILRQELENLQLKSKISDLKGAPRTVPEDSMVVAAASISVPAPAIQLAQEPQDNQPRLTSIIEVADKRKAVIRSYGADKLVSLGSTIAGTWKVVDIRPASVTLLSKKGTKTLTIKE